MLQCNKIKQMALFQSASIHSRFHPFVCYRHVMRQNDYTIDENDVFQIKPPESTDSERDYDSDGPCPDDLLIGGRADSEEDWC